MSTTPHAPPLLHARGPGLLRTQPARTMQGDGSPGRVVAPGLAAHSCVGVGQLATGDGDGDAAGDGDGDAAGDGEGDGGGDGEGDGDGDGDAFGDGDGDAAGVGDGGEGDATAHCGSTNRQEQAERCLWSGNNPCCTRVNTHIHCSFPEAFVGHFARWHTQNPICPHSRSRWPASRTRRWPD